MEMLSPNVSGDRANQSLIFALMETGLETFGGILNSLKGLIDSEKIALSIH